MAMETLRYSLVICIIFQSLAILVLCQDPTAGFISLACGTPPGTSFTDTLTGLNYASDAPFVKSGMSRSIAPEYSNSWTKKYKHVRSFTEGDRNCYNVPVTRGTKYSIRAGFVYGNYDGAMRFPSFDLYIGPNKWSSVEIRYVANIVYSEIIHIATASSIQVCLVNTGDGVPFITLLEFRPLLNTMYRFESESLLLRYRGNIGPATYVDVRYPDDLYDRIWQPYKDYRWTNISTNENIVSRKQSDIVPPPSIVMRTAGTPVDATEDMKLTFNGISTTQKLYWFMYFADFQILGAYRYRAFSLSVNGGIVDGNIIPEFLQTTSSYGTLNVTGAEQLVFSLNETGGSTLPPILNAVELLYVLDLPQPETNQGDVDAILSIKSNYGIKRNWQGDPCGPQIYMWEGLNCSYNNSTPPTITSLNLSSSGLTGNIAPDIANLTYLEILDLSNNDLTGGVPDFLSQVKSLKVLILTGNNLTGTIPADIIAKSKNGLELRVDEDPKLCLQGSCNDKNFVIPIVGAVVAALIVLLAVVGIIVHTNKRRKLQVKAQEILEPKQRRFTYAEVQRMTNNFKEVIGKGGFGTVCHGYINDMDVAVKMLSASSAQGYKEFRAEVDLLMRVHHKSLTKLVGYCDEGTNLGLIYEYMANGNLADHLSDTGNSSQLLSWERRLQIAIDAAQGLEYLHNGCKPPIIHRDVKSANILLGQNLHAKLADFGLSRSFPADGSTHVSTVVAGTPGYLDPEARRSREKHGFTEKSDVYSFGVVLLEIITGQPVIAKTRDKTHIITFASSNLNTGDISRVADPRLRGEFDVNSMWRIVELAMHCVSSDSSTRPHMSQVVGELKDCLDSETATTTQSGHGINSVELILVNDPESAPLAR